MLNGVSYFVFHLDFSETLLRKTWSPRTTSCSRAWPQPVWQGVRWRDLRSSFRTELMRYTSVTSSITFNSLVWRSNASAHSATHRKWHNSVLNCRQDNLVVLPLQQQQQQLHCCYAVMITCEHAAAAQRPMASWPWGVGRKQVAVHWDFSLHWPSFLSTPILSALEIITSVHFSRQPSEPADAKTQKKIKKTTNKNPVLVLNTFIRDKKLSVWDLPHWLVFVLLILGTLSNLPHTPGWTKSQCACDSAV